MEDLAKNNGESSHAANPVASPDGSASPDTNASPIIWQEQNGNKHHGELEKDDEFLFLSHGSNAPIMDHRECTASENNSGGEADDVLMLDPSPAQHGSSTPVSVYEQKSIAQETPQNENGAPENSNKDDTNRMIIDTAAPFESVKAAVTKFKGIVNGNTEETLATERNKQVQLELKKLQDEILRYQKECKEAETANAQVEKELEHSKRLAEELQLRVEKAQSQINQESGHSVRTMLKETDQQTTHNAIEAIKAELKVVRERHASAIVELKSVKQELELIHSVYTSSVQERDAASRKAADSVAASKQAEKSIENVALELATAKELLESAHIAHLKAEEGKICAALSLEIEKLIWENELKNGTGEVQQLNEQMLLTNDVRSKLDRASELLDSLKVELASYKETAVVNTEEEFAEIRSIVEKANDSVNCLKTDLSSLQSEAVKEKEFIATLRGREAQASAAVLSLEEEVKRMNTVLESALMKEETRTKKELQKALQEASEEVEHAKSVANSACEELRKAKADAEKAKAGAIALEMRADAGLKEIEAADASPMPGSSKVKASEEPEEPEEPEEVVTLPMGEFQRLTKKVNDAEKLATEELIAGTRQIEAVLEREMRSLQKLQEVTKAVEEKKRELKAALETIEKAEAEKVTMELELKTLQDRHEHEHETNVKGTQSSTDLSIIGVVRERASTVDEEDGVLVGDSPTASPRGEMGHSITITGAPEPKRRKRMFFARVVMFLARKKVQSLK